MIVVVSYFKLIILNHVEHGIVPKGDQRENFIGVWETLKVVSATFLLVCFLCLKERTCETRKNVFYFTSKALFVLEIIKF